MSRTADRILGSSDLARVTRSIAAEGAVAKVQVESRGGSDEVQHWQPYGFGSAPLAGAQAIRLAVGSHREDLVAMIVDDRRYRPALAAGECAIFDDQKQAVAVRRARIEIGTIGGSFAKVAKNLDVTTLDDTVKVWLAGLATAAKFADVMPALTGTIAATAKAVVE